MDFTEKIRDWLTTKWVQLGEEGYVYSKDDGIRVFLFKLKKNN